MKKWWIIPILFVLLTIAVDAKCGDSFCDPNEDCIICSVDCLCTRDAHDEQVNCTTLFTSEECEKGYCHDKWCSTLEGFQSMFQKASCSDNGSVSLTVKFQELDSVVLTPVEDLKVYMKLVEEATFEEIKGVWYNPSKEGDFRYTKIRDTSSFNSDADLFKIKGDYYVRVKYRVGMSSILFEDKKISCPGTPQATPPAEELKEEPKEEVVEEPAEKPAEEPVKETVEPVKEEPAEQTPTESKKSDIIWYVIIGLIILAAIFFFIRYEIKVAKRIEQQ
ncbi:MAG: hypothetical protein Q8O03_00740 [Nanoarchaeota archaeon]|nr:hypothetical protein [Nanoarchaeota archaeon]